MREELARWVANRLPKKVVYFAVIRVWVNATVDKWSHEEAPKVTAHELLKRLG